MDIVTLVLRRPFTEEFQTYLFRNLTARKYFLGTTSNCLYIAILFPSHIYINIQQQINVR